MNLINNCNKIPKFMAAALMLLPAGQGTAEAEPDIKAETQGQYKVETEAQTQLKYKVEAPPQSMVDDKPYKYTGNLYSRKFHRPHCPFCRVMARYKRICFHFRYQAVAEGYVPCRYCLPRVWTTVRCAIKCQDIDKTCENANLEIQKSADKSGGAAREEAPLGTPGERSNICSP